MAIRIMLTGVPGVGKTSICRALKERGSVDDFVSTGDLIREVSGRRASGDVRLNLSAAVTPDVIREAKALLEARMARTPSEQTVLIDGHTATIGDVGIRSTPDPAQHLMALQPAAIVVLVASAESIDARRQQDHENRRHGNIAEIQRLETILIASSTVAASVAECPMHVLDVDCDFDAALDRVDKVIETIAAWVVRDDQVDNAENTN